MDYSSQARTSFCDGAKVNELSMPQKVVRAALQFKSVRLLLLDEHGEQMAAEGGGFKVASGFLRKEGDCVCLYTCWHVVTGIDPNSRRLPASPAFPRKIRVEMLATGGAAIIGGLRDFVLDLYDDDLQTPRWMQDASYISNEDLANVGLRFPAYHDAVKLPVPQNLDFDSAVLIDDGPFREAALVVTEKILVVGFPYGYSALEDPVPIVLTTYIASLLTKEKRGEKLLDRAGAPGMSGCPVFVDRNTTPRVVGMYTGSVNPGGKRAFGTSFGSFVDLTHIWYGRFPPFIAANSLEAIVLDTDG